MPKPPRPPRTLTRKTDDAPTDRVGDRAVVAKPEDPRQAGLFDLPLPGWMRLHRVGPRLFDVAIRRINTVVPPAVLRSAAQWLPDQDREACLLKLGTFSERQRVFNVNAKVPDGALDLGMPGAPKHLNARM